ncbi:hypothetical protein MLD38_037131 [Melastoma candidum]|uniref:Uncharacterized protein n=1 Tax=Melastoma candidum TaxID=119954 RepID=A0ACB9LLD3_9MYRT|nr:hypothetical protein MLD38_037131 [Melastoma candidum]
MSGWIGRKPAAAGHAADREQGTEKGGKEERRIQQGGGLVCHQKLSLSIDLPSRRISGFCPRNRLEWVAPVDKFLQRSSFRRHNWTFEYNSDVFGLATLVMSVGELEFGQQTILFLSSLLKRIDRLLQFESEPLYRLMRG